MWKWSQTCMNIVTSLVAYKLDLRGMFKLERFGEKARLSIYWLRMWGSNMSRDLSSLLRAQRWTVKPRCQRPTVLCPLLTGRRTMSHPLSPRRECLDNSKTHDQAKDFFLNCIQNQKSEKNFSLSVQEFQLNLPEYSEILINCPWLPRWTNKLIID